MYGIGEFRIFVVSFRCIISLYMYLFKRISVSYHTLAESAARCCHYCREVSSSSSVSARVITGAEVPEKAGNLNPNQEHSVEQQAVLRYVYTISANRQ